MFKIELLSESNFTKYSLDLFIRRQEVNQVYRKSGEGYKLEPCQFTDDWTLNKNREVAEFLLSDECISYLTLDDDKVIGFVGVLKNLVDNYIILEIIQVSEPYRAMGIGKKSFQKAKEEAIKAHSKGLYISACSSEETIAFYTAMGAKVTCTSIKSIAEEESFDLQMVCPI